jgi:hypothetical protein
MLQKDCKQTTVDYRATVDYKGTAQNIYLLYRHCRYYRHYRHYCSLLQSAAVCGRRPKVC